MSFTNIIIICIAVYLIIFASRGIIESKRKNGTIKGKLVAKRTLHGSLEEYRKKAGLEMEDVADELGVAWAQVVKWESGQEDPGTENLLKLAKLYKVPAEELLKDVR